MHPQDRLDAATAEFERAFKAHPEEGNCRLAPTGEPYAVLCCGGLKEEYESCGAFATNPQKAIEMWIEQMGRYAKPFWRNDLAHLYWRMRPLLESEEFLPVGVSDEPYRRLKLWQVVSRLLISDKPIIQAAQTAAA